MFPRFTEHKGLHLKTLKKQNLFGLIRTTEASTGELVFKHFLF